MYVNSEDEQMNKQKQREREEDEGGGGGASLRAQGFTLDSFCSLNEPPWSLAQKTPPSP